MADLKTIEFDENNSGGSFWLSREQYDNLLAAGFYIKPITEDWEIERYGADGQSGDFGDMLTRDGVPYFWRGNLRVEAASLQEAVEKWESITGEDFFAEGCNCCGCPFSAHVVDEDGSTYEYVSGDSVTRTVNRPW